MPARTHQAAFHSDSSGAWSRSSHRGVLRRRGFGGGAHARAPNLSRRSRLVTLGYHSRFHFPHRRTRVEFTVEVPHEGDVVLDDWVVSRSEVCKSEDVVEGQRIYFDVWVERKPE